MEFIRMALLMVVPALFLAFPMQIVVSVSYGRSNNNSGAEKEKKCYAWKRNCVWRQQQWNVKCFHPKREKKKPTFMRLVLARLLNNSRQMLVFSCAFTENRSKVAHSNLISKVFFCSLVDAQITLLLIRCHYGHEVARKVCRVPFDAKREKK